VRAVARASSRFATFAQQISSTKPTTPRNSIDVVFRSLPIIVSCIGSSVTLRPLLNSGTRAQARPPRQIGLRRLDATPGFIRPTPALMGARARRHVGNGRIAHIDVRPRISNLRRTRGHSHSRRQLDSLPTIGSRLKRLPRPR
jgi:hypothetical protein